MRTSSYDVIALWGGRNWRHYFRIGQTDDHDDDDDDDEYDDDDGGGGGGGDDNGGGDDDDDDDDDVDGDGSCTCKLYRAISQF